MTFNAYTKTVPRTVPLWKETQELLLCLFLFFIAQYP